MPLCSRYDRLSGRPCQSKICVGGYVHARMTTRLRPGLRFHDGTPVLARDVVASLNRWAARDQMGLMLKAIEQELTAVDDRTIKWVLKKPYPKMLLALGKNNSPVAFVMPERI